MVTEYRTVYLPEAAFLVALGVPITVERTDPRTVEFVADDADGKIEHLAQQYYGSASCPALKYYRALTQLRGEINKALGTSRSKGGAR